ncbi:hypothetical protein C0J52_18976 [Blattella germanica]|nr:hypothetical protein C0J52_18976 [Blattella germanica]
MPPRFVSMRDKDGMEDHPRCQQNGECLALRALLFGRCQILVGRIAAATSVACGVHDDVLKPQRSLHNEFRREFGIDRNHAVPSANSIKIWVRNLEATGSTVKKKGGGVNTIRTPDIVRVVRKAIEWSPHLSARRNSVSHVVSKANVRCVLEIFVLTSTKSKLLTLYTNRTT